MRREDWEHWGEQSVDSCTFISTAEGYTEWLKAQTWDSRVDPLYRLEEILSCWLGFFSCLISLLLSFWDSSYTYVRPFGHVPHACYTLLCFLFLFLAVLHLEIFCSPVSEFTSSFFCCVQSSLNAIH